MRIIPDKCLASRVIGSPSSGVYVEVKNQGGGLTDGPFDLDVACNMTGWDFAVVGYTANLVRSSPGATLTHLGVGRYDVNFTAGVGVCAYLATVGDPDNGIVVNPSGVYTGSGSTNNSVYHRDQEHGRRLPHGWNPVPPGHWLGPARLPLDQLV